MYTLNFLNLLSTVCNFRFECPDSLILTSVNENYPKLTFKFINDVYMMDS